MTTAENTAIEIIVPEREQLPPSLLSNIELGFKDSFAQAEKWRVQALAIKVTSIDQRAEMKLARTIRLELKGVRVAAEKTRKALKEDALRMGKAIDGVNNLLLAAIVPLEKHLEEQEQFGERLLEAERQATLARRSAELAPYLSEGQLVPALDVMSAEQFANYLEDAKTLHAAKIEAAKRAEAERIAKEQAEAAERERLRLENERLVKEAAEREAAAKAEREAAEKALAAERAAAAEKQRLADAKAKAEREAAEKELARIKAESDAAARKAEEIAARERHEARKAAEQAAAYAAEQKRLAESKLLTERLEREKLEREIAEDKAAEQAALAAAAKAAKKAARAPDKAKALAFAATVRTLKAPDASTAEGKAVMAEITAKIEGFAKWIETQASSL
jgi:hypothetical protein